MDPPVTCKEPINVLWISQMESLKHTPATNVVWFPLPNLLFMYEDSQWCGARVFYLYL